MKIANSMLGFNISAKGLSVQRKKMNLISENIANADTIRTQDGKPYRRKALNVTQNDLAIKNGFEIESRKIAMNVTNKNHIGNPRQGGPLMQGANDGLSYDVVEDTRMGEVVHMPDHPDADEKGYVEMSNVNVITEMVEMIAATRSYEANLTALNSSKQMAKDALEI
ncbi:MAG: flagellar basal body rod protein FlgC [Ignavibacteriaceae bacterium]|nr:flagellar basal body rod protein FlgC [Ignavibacteriaceae bacterium]HRI45513.1 flagellar basal body rod protein FlgC [Ignavibacteriaceae bacterium]